MSIQQLGRIPTWSKSSSHSNQARENKNRQLGPQGDDTSNWSYPYKDFTKLSILRPYTIVNPPQHSFQNVNLSSECETEKIITIFVHWKIWSQLCEAGCSSGFCYLWRLVLTKPFMLQEIAIAILLWRFQYNKNTCYGKGKPHLSFFVCLGFFLGGGRELLSAFAFAYLFSFFGKALLLLSLILRPQELFCWLGLYAVLSFDPLPSLAKSVLFQTDISSATIHLFLNQQFPCWLRIQSLLPGP